MCCGLSSRSFLREVIAKPDSLLSKYPLETNLVVTNITTLFQLAIYQHVLGSDFSSSTLRYIFSHFEALNPTHSAKSIENIKIISYPFSGKPSIFLFRYYFYLQTLGSISYQCVRHSSERSRGVKTCMHTQLPR